MWDFIKNQIRHHRTVTCPHCGKDSWRSYFDLPAKCMWCNKIIRTKSSQDIKR